MFFILIALQAIMTLYVGADYHSNTDLWTFVTNMDNWNSAVFVLGVFGLALSIGLATIVVGGFLGVKTDFMVFAVAIPGLITMGIVFKNFATFMRDELTSRLAAIDPACLLEACPAANWITAVVVGPIAFYYVWTVVEWWRGKDM